MYTLICAKFKHISSSINYLKVIKYIINDFINIGKLINNPLRTGNP